MSSAYSQRTPRYAFYHFSLHCLDVTKDRLLFEKAEARAIQRVAENYIITECPQPQSIPAASLNYLRLLRPPAI